MVDRGLINETQLINQNQIKIQLHKIIKRKNEESKIYIDLLS